MTRRISLAPLVQSAVAVAMILVCASALTAQKSRKEEDSTTRTLQGTVSDGAGNPIQQAVVQLKDTRTLQILSFITKEDGGYHFASLKNDVEYEVKAIHGGVETDWKRVSIFDARKIITVNLKLEKK
jgi:hypothetical protein